MKLLVIFVLVLVQNFVSGAPKKPLPEYIHVCKRNDPHLEDCIISSVEKLRPKLTNGIPELEVPPIEPLLIGTVNATRSTGFNVIVRELTLHGISGFKVNRFVADIDNLRLEIGVTIPNLEAHGRYFIDAQVLVMRLKGDGPFIANATDVTGDAVIQGHFEQRDGEEYGVFDTMDIKLGLTNYNIRLENLFNGDKAAGEAINKVLNDNKKQMIKVLGPIFEKATSVEILDIANKIVKNYPVDQLLPYE